MKKPLLTRIARAWNELIGDGGMPKGAQDSRLLADWVLRDVHIDEEVRRSARKMRRRARQMGRDNAYMKQFLRMLIVNVLGPQGIRLQAQVRTRSGELDAPANQAIEAAWKGWAKSRVTIDGRLTLHALEEMILRGLARDGEVFIRKIRGLEGNPYRYGFQILDPGLIDEELNVPPVSNENEIRMGIEMDRFGRRIRYHVWERLPWTAGFQHTDRYTVPAEEMIHIYTPEMPGQSRGLTWFDAVMVPAHVLDGYEEAELFAARGAAAKMGFIEQTAEGLGAAEGDGEDGQKPLEMDANPGAIELLAPGQKFSPWDPQHPTSAFEPFTRQIIRKISSGLGASYNGLANDLTSVNYSSIRSGVLIERDFWRLIQALVIREWREEIYPEFLEFAQLSGKLDLPSRDFDRYHEASWRPRGWQWVDPLKDVAAAEKAIALGLDSRSRLLSERGEDFEDRVEELRREKELADAAGVSISPAGAMDPALVEKLLKEDEDKGSDEDKDDEDDGTEK